ncbi:MAG TPA: hypothetical protein VK891_01885 [Euzebyales bacterium]|nr:hypothetical protein [Euzebyales bacterium]
MDQIPIYDAAAPVVRTLHGDELADRIRLIERLRRDLVRDRRTIHGLLLHFPTDPDIDADARQFTLGEQRCCQFWGFAVETG